MKSKEEVIAEEIVEQLFVDGFKKKADRLALMSKDGKDLGGWSKGVVMDRIIIALKGKLK